MRLQRGALFGSLACSAFFACFLPSLEGLSGGHASDASLGPGEDRSAPEATADARTSPGTFLLRRTEMGDASRVDPVFATLDGNVETVGCPTESPDDFWFGPCARTFCYPSPTPVARTDGPYRMGQLGMSVYAGGTPHDARFAFAGRRVSTLDGGADAVADAGDASDASAIRFDYPLWVATPSTRCGAPGAPPVRVDPTDDVLNQQRRHVLPRFRSDGKRIAYLDTDPETGTGSVTLERVMTVGVDGSEPRKLMDFGDNSLSLVDMPPVWLSIGGRPYVAWSQTNGGISGYGVQATSDEAIPSTLEVVTECEGVVQELAMFDHAGSSVIVLARSDEVNLSLPSATTRLVIAPASALPIDCTKFQELVVDQPPGSRLRDVQVAPDGNLIATTANWPVDADAGGPGGPDATSGVDAGRVRLDAKTRVYITPVKMEGNSPPSQPCSATSFDGDFYDFGPQWVDGGRSIIWTRTPYPLSSPLAPPEDDAGGVQSGIWTADIEGGKCVRQRPLVVNRTTSQASVTFLGPASSAPACGVGTAPGSLWNGLPIALALAIVLRRRRS